MIKREGGFALKVGDKVIIVKEGLDEQFNGDSGVVVAIVKKDMVIVDMEVMYLSQPIVFHKDQLKIIKDGE